MDKQFIQTMKDRLEHERVYVEQKLANEAGNFDREDGDAKVAFPNIGDEEEDSVHEVEEYDKELATERSYDEQLGDIVEALQRIEQGSYGVCEECGKEIPPARLEASPTATACITCISKQ